MRIDWLKLLMLLRDKDKDEILRLANLAFSTPLKIWAYGSRVNGTAHDASDLDLVIIAENQNSLDINEFIKFKELLVESNIPIIVQVVDWYRIPKSFHKNILKQYKELARVFAS